MKILKILEDSNIAHRDVKAENILVNTETKEIKLLDFGFSCLFVPNQLVTSGCGTPSHTAPEVINQEPFDPVKADVWSSGILLFFMLCGMRC
jgi:serine/threonine protein kinase